MIENILWAVSGACFGVAVAVGALTFLARRENKAAAAQTCACSASPVERKQFRPEFSEPEVIGEYPALSERG